MRVYQNDDGTWPPRPEGWEGSVEWVEVVVLPGSAHPYPADSESRAGDSLTLL